MGQIRGAIGAPIPIDVLVATVGQFEARKDVNGSPYYWPAREGRVVYERPADLPDVDDSVMDETLAAARRVLESVVGDVG